MKLSEFKFEVFLTQNPISRNETNFRPKNIKSSLGPLKNQPRPYLDLKSPSRSNEIVENPFRASELLLLTKVNSKVRISIISKFGPQIHDVT